MRNRIFLALSLAGMLSITGCDRAEDVIPIPLNNCLVELFGSENFGNTSTSDYVGKGEFPTLEDMPTMLKDWRGKIKGIKVGRLATLQVWEQENFQGVTKTYQPEFSNPNVDPFRSMKITCR